MSEYWVSADRIFDGDKFYNKFAMHVANGRIVAMTPADDVPKGAVKHHHEGVLTQGFFDIQVNGGGGVLLNADPTLDGVRKIAMAHRGFGTTAILPTVITDTPEVMEAAALACLEARNETGVYGIHIEGPHISTPRRGTHDPKFIRPMDQRTLDLVRKLRDAAFPTLITVAPENTTNEQIAELSEMGAVVSIGHSDVAAGVVTDALAAGVSCFTHLFNAMSPMVNRAPGVTGAAIASDAWCSVIADSIHVDPMMVKIAFDARSTPDRMIAVSDAMSTVGGPDEFELYGRNIRLKDGHLINAEGSLAGAHLTMLTALQNLIAYGIPEIAALRMCRHNPAQLMGLGDQMGLIGSSVDDVLHLDAAFNLKSVGIAAEQSEPAKATVS